MILDLLFPARCAGCSTAGVAWCAHCAASMDGLFEVRRTALRAGVRAFAVTAYAGPARRLVLAYKERGRRELAAVFGLAVAEAVPKALARVSDQARAGPATRCWLVPAPSRWTAVRARGGNHVEVAARWAAGELRRRGVPAEVAPVLRLRGRVRDSVGLSGAGRAANLHGRVRLHGTPPPQGEPTLVVDDVITTGATAAACTTTLHNAGVHTTAVLALTATV
jgi:predicted amidophosphoribosyltransferase